MAETLNINRERRALRVLERLDKRRSQGKFDFTIIVGTQKILAEQNVLASGSDYFEAMLSHDTKERQNGKMEMFDVDLESVKICIGFIYGREVTFPMENYEKLMFVARMMQLEELCDAMEEEMKQQLTLNTFYIIRSLALKFGLAKLINACRWFAEGNLGLLCMDDKFNALEKTFIIEMLKSETVEMDEGKKLKMVVSWVKNDVERSMILLELLKCIDVSKISKEVIQYYIRDEPLISTDAECLHFISLSIIESRPPRSQKKKILIFGKESQNLQLYSPDDKTIQNLHISKPNHQLFSVVCLYDYIYCLCKDKSVYRLRNLEANWERMKDMIKEHGSCPPAAVLSGRIYVIGGHNGLSTRAVECYNPWNANWQPLESLPHKIQCAEVLASERYIYRFGGKVGDQYVNDVARLDVLRSQWETLPPMNERKGYVSAAKCKGRIYVAGGFIYTTTGTVRRMKTFESYNPHTNQWTVLPQMNICRSYFNLFAVGGFLYAVGGYSSSPDSIEKYDNVSGEWKIEIETSEKLRIATSIAIEV